MNNLSFIFVVESNVYFPQESNSNSNDACYNSNVVSVEELLEEPQASSDSEDCIEKVCNSNV